MSDHQKVYERVLNVCAGWRNLGGALGVDYHTLDTIESDHSGNAQNCLRIMLARRIESEFCLTWGELCCCLRSCTVKRNDVAANIEKEISGQFQSRYNRLSAMLNKTVTIFLNTFARRN